MLTADNSTGAVPAQTAAHGANLPPAVRSILAAHGRDPNQPGAVQLTLILSDRPAAKTYHLNPSTGAPEKVEDPALSGGTIYRATLAGAAPLAQLRRLLEHLPNKGVLIAGRMADPRDVAPLTTKDRLAARPGHITRTKGNFVYPPGAPGLGVLDHDAKDLPPALLNRLRDGGGLLAALGAVCPEFRRAGLLSRPSSSCGIWAPSTGGRTRSGSLHVYIMARDGSDLPAFVTRLHQRLVLAGWGWVFISEEGVPQIRSLIDIIASGNPIWLTFEADAVLGPGLEYAPGARECVVERDGVFFDTATAPELTSDELVQFKQIEAELLAAKAPEIEAKRATAKQKREDHLVARGMARPQAKARVARAMDHQRLDSAEVVFLDDGRAPTVAEILRDPDAYEGKTGADPREPDYGGGKNKAIWHTRGRFVRCYSQAHGGQLFVAGWTGLDIEDARRARHDPAEIARMYERALFTRLDIEEAWQARHDPAEIARMYERALFDDPEADLKKLAEGGVPSGAQAEFGAADKLVLEALWGRLARGEVLTEDDYAALALVPEQDMERVLRPAPAFFGTELAPIRAGLDRARNAVPQRFARPSRPVPLPADHRPPVSLDEAKGAAEPALRDFLARVASLAGTMPLARGRGRPA